LRFVCEEVKSPWREERGREISPRKKRSEGRRSLCAGQTLRRSEAGRKKSAYCVRNDRLGKPHEERRYRRLASKDDSATRGKEGHDVSCPYLDQGGTTPDMRA